jgi:deazaflavin-dependent oxidoreductase (nitroreductase family)
MMTTRYEEPNRAGRAGSAGIRWLAELGISLFGTRALYVRGRKSAKRRAVVINLLTVDGVDYIVSPRGNTQWVRNVRAAGVVETGPRWRRVSARVTEVDDAAKSELLKPYLARWYWQIKDVVVGLTPESTDDQLRAAAPLIPMFALAGDSR